MARHPVVDELVAVSPAVTDSNSLIGVFQAFRPDGLPEIASLHELAGGAEFGQRLQSIYDAVSMSNRSDNMKDAYFIVRDPPVPTAALCDCVGQFVSSIASATQTMENPPVRFAELPAVRMLEGKPPKHPRAAREKSELLNLLQTTLPTFIGGLFEQEDASESEVVGHQLAESLYFVACDSWLRDYVRLPLLREAAIKTAVDQACTAYFQLWRHGVKYRVFSNERIDFYLPRRTDGTLIDAGQFANR